MPQDTNTDQVILSRFFQQNIISIKRKSIIEHFDTSSYFCKMINEAQNNDTRKKSKRKTSGPQFKGFSDADKKSAANKITELDHKVAKIEDDIDELKKHFFGFPKEEIDSSIVLSNIISKEVQKIKNNITSNEIQKPIENNATSNEIQKPIENNATSNELRNIENNMLKCVLGFSKPEQKNATSKMSNMLDKCVEIRCNIYKSIDRRILLYHLKKEKPRKKMVCSKFWSKPENSSVKLEEKNYLNKVENISSKYFDLKSFKILPRKNGFKKEMLKTEVSNWKEENDFMLEIHNLHNELRAIRERTYSPSKHLKPQDAPFIQIKKELIMPCFVPPKSPHSLIEEDLYHDPWALLVATIFLNKTSGRNARPYIFWFLDDNPDPLVLLDKRVEELETYFGALGLQKTRAYQVWRMSHDFIYKNWKKVSELYGIGKYGEDAFRMFCLGDFSFEPSDRYLRIYKAWYEMQEKNDRILEMNT